MREALIGTKIVCTPLGLDAGGEKAFKAGITCGLPSKLRADQKRMSIPATTVARITEMVAPKRWRVFRCPAKQDNSGAGRPV